MLKKFAAINLNNDEVKAVIDINSPIYNRFTNKEKEFLEQVSKLLETLFI